MDSRGHPPIRLSHETSQPTLDSRRPGSLVDRIDALGLIDLAALASFEAARDDPAPICSTLRLTFELAGRLRRAHVLKLLDEVPRGPAWGQGRAIYDPIAWEYLADPPEPGVLREHVAARIRKRTTGETVDDAVWLWQRLADAELESYSAHLLRKHQMDPTWARAIVDRTESELEDLCLAQRRALAWIGLKEGAAAFLRTKGDAKQCLDAIVSEIRRQARWLRRHQPLSTEWIPSAALRQPLLLRTFLTTFPLGYRYWTEVPSPWGIEAGR